MIVLRIIIAEDDPAMRLILRRVIEGISDIEVVAEAEDGAQLVELSEKLAPDVVVLDISMPTLSGLEAAKKIFSISPTISLIFVTAHDNYTHEAFELYAFDYIVKPFNLERIKQTMARIKELRAGSGVHSDKSSKLAVKSSEGHVFLDTHDIILVTRSNRQTIITTTKGTVTTYEPLQSLSTKLGADTFFRCHKGYIINAGMVMEISPCGDKTHLVRLASTTETALMTRERAKEFQAQYC